MAMAAHVQPSVLRKPLLAAERMAPIKTILVTGATGYIGSRVVERLLACGHAVHVLARPRANPGPEDVLQYLKSLPGATAHLTVISGDVTDAACLRAAMSACEQLVHLAAVVDVLPPRDEQHKQQMIDTALQGTRLVLDAATESGSISKVILASSIVAVMWDWWERGRDHVYSEEDWTLDSSVALNCYAYCKRESERLAYKMAEGQRWKLATINPGVVFGPVACAKLAHSASVWQPIVEHMNGAKYPWTSNMIISHVDLDDVAAAICGLLATPGASGRHLLMSGEPPSMPQIARLLSAAHPSAKVPLLTAPWWAVALLARYNTHKLGFDLHKLRAMHAKPFRVDASKIQRVLPGFQYIPLAASVRAAADSVVALGLAATQNTTLGCCISLGSDLGRRISTCCDLLLTTVASGEAWHQAAAPAAAAPAAAAPAAAAPAAAPAAAAAAAAAGTAAAPLAVPVAVAAAAATAGMPPLQVGPQVCTEELEEEDEATSTPGSSYNPAVTVLLRVPSLKSQPDVADQALPTHQAEGLPAGHTQVA